jgi:glycosyltransferase involved in cell wall biosynthesis
MKLSICMMVKNEEKNLDRCLQSLKPLLAGIASELIIVDTGSEDSTVEIAKNYTDKLYFHTWNNDFSAMRNITISYATGEWVLIIDADEVLENTQAIVDFLKSKVSKKFNAAVVFVNNYMNDYDYSKFSSLLSHRLFRRTKKFCYTGAVHNQPVFDQPTEYLGAKIHHYGYMSTDKELMERKFVRTSTLLLSELEKDPEHIYYLFQLSVTYGMHGEYYEAIEYIERARNVFHKRNKPRNCMFVLTHGALMYQLTRNFKKVEEICLEALEISDEYIDINYYLAEAQAVLKKPEVAIASFEKYLKMLEGYYNVPAKDVGVIDYSLGHAEVAYVNLANLYKKVANYERALHYAEKITEKTFIKDNLSTIIELYLRLGKYNDLKDYYDKVVEPELYDTFYQYLEANKSNFSPKARLAVAEVFSVINDNYGLFSRIVVEDQQGAFSTETYEKIKEIDFARLSISCSAILYYLVKHKYPLHTILTDFKEIWINCLFEVVAKSEYYDDLSMILYEYLQVVQSGNSMSEYKLRKTLCRYILLLGKLSDAEQQEILSRYVEDGIAYMQSIYNPCIFTDILVYEVRTNEEVFMVFMYQAQLNKNVDKAKYAQNLRLALEAYPEMTKAVSLLLEEIQADLANSQSTEMDKLKKQLIGEIKLLIEQGDYEKALGTIEECAQIIGKDLELVSLKADIMLNMH